MLKIVKPLTYKSRIRQIGGGNKFLLEDNEVFATTDGCVIAPRNLYTDNITFLNNTFVDIRASHIHDIGCGYGKLITTSLTETDLLDMGLLHLNQKATQREREFLEKLKKKGKYDGKTDVLVYVCEDIPPEYLRTQKVGFVENNELFRQMLKATDVSNIMSDIMGYSVYLNIGWFLKKKRITPNMCTVFSDLLIT